MIANIQVLHVRLGYSPEQADCIFDYLDCHRVTSGGRYRLEDSRIDSCLGEDGKSDPDRFVVRVYTHRWLSPDLQEESTKMCSFRFNTGWPGIEYMTLAAAFDWDAAWAELAVLELAALGEIVHGRRIAARRKMATSTPVSEAESAAIRSEFGYPQRPNANLSYLPPDFEGILTYIKDHSFPFDGRYDILPENMRYGAELDQEVILVTVFSPRGVAAKGRRILCTFCFHRGKQGNVLVLGADHDAETAWAELAILEQDALGRTIHGKQAIGDQSTAVTFPRNGENHDSEST